MTAPTIKLDAADDIAYWLPRHRITARQLRQWAKRGHITRHPGDLYCAREVADYLDNRPDADTRRADGVARCAESRRLTL